MESKIIREWSEVTTGDVNIFMSKGLCNLCWGYIEQKINPNRNNNNYIKQFTSLTSQQEFF